MNETDAGRLLTIAITLDAKMPQPDADGFMRRMWARHLADVPAEAAERALSDYYRSERYLEKREPISPADIVQWWNARRRPNERERSGEPRRRVRPAFDAERIHAGVEACVAELTARKAIEAGEDRATAVEVAQGEAAARRRVRAVACPHCQASPGNGCVVVGVAPERPMSGHHPSRADAAFAAANPISDPS